MSEVVFDYSAAAIGTAAALLGLLALAETHTHSSMPQRVTIGVLVMLCLNVAADGYLAAQVEDRTAGQTGVAFALALACTWWCKLRAARLRT